MSRIRIRNFGPIKKGMEENEGWIDIKKVTVFIGNQGSGKSTVAKLISTCSWIEKALVRGTIDKKTLENGGENKLLKFTFYHRLEKYFKQNGAGESTIEYQGNAYEISFVKGKLSINEILGKDYVLPQLMYVPAERNFIAYVKSPKELKLASDSLQDFLSEFDNAKKEIRKTLSLPINNASVEYDELSDELSLKGSGFNLSLSDASSGFQSFVPLFLVSDFLARSVQKQTEANREPMSNEDMIRYRKGVEEIWNNPSLTDEQRRINLSVLSSKFNKAAFINIVEEPEQNLYPVSQQKMLNSLLGFNNMNEGNKLIMTTHSPYLISYLTLAVKGGVLYNQVVDENLRNKLNKIVPAASAISPDSLAVYELKEQDGSIHLLETYNGLPSDENQLNSLLEEGNESFAQLLEIQEEL